MKAEAIKDLLVDNVLVVMGGFFAVLMLGMYIERKRAEKQ